MLDLATEFGARADRRLRAEEIAWFVTVRPDGTPIPVPVWFVWDGETILLYSQPRAGKVRNIAANPRVSLHLDTDAHGDDMIVVTGEARVDPSAPAMHVMPAYAEKYRARVDDGVRRSLRRGCHRLLDADPHRPRIASRGSDAPCPRATRRSRSRAARSRSATRTRSFSRAPGTPSSTSSATTSRSRTARSRRCGRPMVLKRFVDGAEGEAFFQKRAPERGPTGSSGELSLPVRAHRGRGRRGRRRRLAWVVNLGCIDLHPHPVRADDLDHPDELRVDLDPGPGVAVGRRSAGSPCVA